LPANEKTHLDRGQSGFSFRGAKGIRTPALTRQNAILTAVSFRLGPIQSRSVPAVSFSGLDGVKTYSAGASSRCALSPQEIVEFSACTSERRPISTSESLPPLASGFASRLASLGRGRRSFLTRVEPEGRPSFPVRLVRLRSGRRSDRVAGVECKGFGEGADKLVQSVCVGRRAPAPPS
jgi:hypothetical protein